MSLPRPLLRGQHDVAKTDDTGLITVERRGEAAVRPLRRRLRRNTVTAWATDRLRLEQPEAWSEIDRFTANKWERMKIEPSGLAAIRISSAHLPDLTGLPPAWK